MKCDFHMGTVAVYDVEAISLDIFSYFVISCSEMKELFRQTISYSEIYGV